MSPDAKTTTASSPALRRWPLTCATAVFGLAGLCFFALHSEAEEPTERGIEVASVETLATPTTPSAEDRPAEESKEEVVAEFEKSAPDPKPMAEAMDLPAAPPPPESPAEPAAMGGAADDFIPPAGAASSAAPAKAKKGKAKPKRLRASAGKDGDKSVVAFEGRGGEGIMEEALAVDEIATGERSGYDRQLSARRLTAGTHDDNRDIAGWQRFLSQMNYRLPQLGLSAQQLDWQEPGPRHVDNPRGLDVVLVMDTTGSMGDELEYLKVELEAIAQEVESEFPQVEQRWGMVAYKDVGDEYVTRVANFSDIGSFTQSLGGEHAGGGGDTPEAMDLALHASSGLSWRKGDDTARLVFLVADAPPHAGDGTQNYMKAISNMRAEKTTLYPVAGSGVADDAEILMRVGAKATGGQYIFLTDHSGIGGHHAAPHVDDYQVETLHDAMRRMIRLELGDQPAQAVAVHTPPQVEPVPCGYAVAHADAEASWWDQLRERLGVHFTYAGAFIMWLMMAIFIATRLRRRRQHIA